MVVNGRSTRIFHYAFILIIGYFLSGVGIAYSKILASKLPFTYTCYSDVYDEHGMPDISERENLFEFQEGEGAGNDFVRCAKAHVASYNAQNPGAAREYLGLVVYYSVNIYRHREYKRNGVDAEGEFVEVPVGIPYIQSKAVFECNNPSYPKFESPYYCSGIDYTPDKKEKNRGKGDGCTSDNPVNIATGNKFFNKVDYTDKVNPLLSITRTYDSSDGIWFFNNATKVRYNVENPSYAMSFEDGSRGEFKHEYNPYLDVFVWKRFETKTHEYITEVDDNVVYYGSKNIQLEFNASGQLIRKSKGRHTVTYSYGTDGSTIIIDPASQRQLAIKYDEFQRIKEVGLPNSKIITYHYDDMGRLFSITNQGKETSFLFANVDHPRAITAIIDANGDTYKNISYFADGKVKTSSLSEGSELISLEYPSENTTVTTNALGKITSYHFVDIKGVKKISQVEGHASEGCLAANRNYEYDTDGLLTSKTDWKGVKTEYRYYWGYEVARVEAVGSPEERTISTSRDPNFGLPLKITIGNRVTTYKYDSNGSLISKDLSITRPETEPW